MAELEDEIELEQDIADDLGSEDDISYDQAMEWKSKAERLDKAEKALVERKRAEKLAKKDNPQDWDMISKKDLEIREEVLDFISNNPELKEYKEDLLKYKKDWFTLRQAKALVEADDKTIENRKKLETMNITDWVSSWKTVYSRDELAKLSQSEYNAVMDLKDKWQVRIK